MGLLAAGGTAWAQQTSHTTSHTKTKTKTESYMVIEVGGEYRAIRTSALKDEKKRVETDYKKALDLWQDEVKVDSKAKKPAKLTVTVKKSGFKTQKGADEYLAKLKEEDQEAGKDSKDSKNTKEGKESTDPAGKKVVF